MTLRYCARCRADVEDRNGFCLLGHRFPEQNEDPMAKLRAEVDRAFDRVQLDISSALEEKLDDAVKAPRMAVYEQLKSDAEAADEIVESRRDVWRQLSEDEALDRDDPILSFSPSPRMEWGPAGSRRRRRG